MEELTKNALRVDFIQVEMPSNHDSSCSACDKILNNLVAAIMEVQKLFDKLDTEILFKQNTVSSIKEAEKAKITASPTIRVGNLDFYPEHVSEESESREWTWQGRKISEPDKDTLIEVLLKGYFEPENERKDKKPSAYILKYLTPRESQRTNSCCS